jgi:hypothetical protein
MAADGNKTIGRRVHQADLITEAVCAFLECNYEYESPLAPDASHLLSADAAMRGLISNLSGVLAKVCRTIWKV